MTDEQDKKEPAWEKREFAINQRVREICGLAIKATESEIKALRRKLQKLQYGGPGK